MHPYLVVEAVLLVAVPAAAPVMMPQFSYKASSFDGRFELVMLGSGDLPETWPAPARAEAAAVRATYPRSGLYPAGNTTDPLWTVEEYWEYPALPFPDGVHAARIHGGYGVVLRAIQQDGFPTDSRLPPDAERAALDAPAITFYARGRPIRTYTVRELVSDPEAVPHGPGRAIWCDGSMFYTESGRFMVETTDGNRILFDPTTGEVISRMKTWRWLVRQAWIAAAVLAAVVAVAVVGVVWWRVRRRRMEAATAAAPEPRGMNA